MIMSKSCKSDVTHVDGEGEGCVTRCKWKKEVASNGWTRMVCEFTGHDHRKNGRNFHVANDLSWYNLDFSVEGSARARLERELKRGFIVLKARKPDPRNSRAKQTWWMTRSGNFKSQSKPWSFNAHHLIPIGSLHSAFSIGKESGKSDLLLLQKAKYNINAGVNLRHPLI
ncbi:hypothetical protein ACN28I_42510 [Archangium gephyra]|uniref:hypothetical protein n=1 Tax=Archangium gephyra TaxID=48 RepID=UPI003B791D5C